MIEWQAWMSGAIAIVLLTGIAIVGLLGFRIPAALEVLIAVARSIAQLALLSIILSGVIADLRWVAIALLVMFAVAILTAAHRARDFSPSLLWLGLAMAAGPTATMLIVFLTGAIEFSPRYALAIGGIVIGSTMTIAVLTQRILQTTITDRWDEVEGWLALGATPRQSTAVYARAAVHTALLPSIDQTRTTGIVVLPGAFVGAVFAGASPLEAGRFQLIVLAGILAAGVITATLLAFGAPQRRPSLTPRTTHRHP
ncbi:ABC transporter permease [Microbacterium rhizophilus]|uniref:ABC transporter permease n=1 Tax=Microbacterium rhizophilus TaxID=3138934 RepID=UPI0031EA8E92